MKRSQVSSERYTFNTTFRFSSSPQNTSNRMLPQRTRNKSLKSFVRGMLVPISASIGNAYRSANGIVQFSLLLGACPRHVCARMRKRDRRRESTSFAAYDAAQWGSWLGSTSCSATASVRLGMAAVTAPAATSRLWNWADRWVRARHVRAPTWRVLPAGDCESADAYPYLRWALV